MDIEKLIEQLRWWAEHCDRTNYGCHARPFLLDAATALSTLQAENSKLRESRDHWKRLAHELSEGVNGKDAEHERLQAENEKLRAEVKRLKSLIGETGQDLWSAENQRADQLEAELEQVKEYAREATITMNNLYGACGQFCDETIWSFWQRRRGQKEI